MGKATVTSESGSGLYTVSIDYGSADIAQRVARYQARIDELNPQIAQLESDLLTAQADVRSKWEAVDNRINLFAVDPSDENRDAISEATALAIEANIPVNAIRQKLGGLKIEKSNLQSLIDQFNAEVVTESRGVWCADLTEGITGEVGTIDIDGESRETLIVPGGESPTASDGDMRDPMSMSGAAAYLNAAILPGWQKYSPTYRTGVIASINREENRGTVTLDDALSTAQNLPINQSDSVEGEFDYLTCNHVAFSVGDEVVVQFEAQDWSQPKIIGFRSNPKPCGVQRIIVPLELLSTTTSSYLAQATTTSPVMAIDQQFSLCAGGQYTTLRTGSLPPGYQATGTVQNFSWLDYQFQAHISTLGVITSGERRGDLNTFEFNTDLRISGSPAVVSSTQPDGYLAGGFDDLALGGFTIDRLVTLETSANGALMTEYEAHNGINFTLAQPDLEENDAVVTCLTALLGDYLSVPSSISVVPAGGGAAQQLQFERFFDLASFDGYSDFPATLSGLALMFKAPDPS